MLSSEYKEAFICVCTSHKWNLHKRWNTYLLSQKRQTQIFPLHSMWRKNKMKTLTCLESINIYKYFILKINISTRMEQCEDKMKNNERKRRKINRKIWLMFRKQIPEWYFDGHYTTGLWLVLNFRLHVSCHETTVMWQKGNANGSMDRNIRVS